MRLPQILVVASTSSPSLFSPTTSKSVGVALKIVVFPASLVAYTRSPTGTGDAVNPPPSGSFHTSRPESLFQQTANPSSVTANRFPFRTHIDGTYTRDLFSHASLPEPSA